MKKSMLFVAASMLWGATTLSAQIVTTSPAPLQESSQNIVLTYHADSPLGNGGLANLPESTYIYAHIGVITDKSTSTGDWKYVQTPWPASDGSNAQTANTEKNHMVYTAPNTYTLAIGDIREYFGITDPDESVRYIAMVPRTADGVKQGKTTAGGDILVDVLSEGLGMTFTSSSVSNILTAAKTITFTAQATKKCDISISINGTVIASANDTELVCQYNFSNTGTYKVEATAKSGDQTVTKTLGFAYPAPAEAGTYPGGVPVMGTVRNADGTVTFCLAAPEKTSCLLVGSWDDYMPVAENAMKYQDYNGQRYFFTTVSGLEDGQWYPYYYVVDARYKVGDPYCHLVLDCFNDKWISPEIWPDMPQYPYDKVEDNIVLSVYRSDIDDYNWSPFTIPSHDNLVVYELLFRDFTGTVGEANANGTVRQAIEKIPYLKELGVNAVELMPIMEFNGNNSWGYNTNFYFAPDKAYGSPKDYKDFIDICHQNGIAVILDIVFNQSDGLHPWYQMYSITKNPFYNRIAPHSYSVLNDWNQDNELVQQQWTDAIKYWLTAYNVDGFRFDLVKGLGDNNSYGQGTDAYNKSRVERMKRLHSVITSVKPKGIHINEDLAGDFEEIKLGEDGQLQWANINGNSCQYAMGWGESSGNGVYTKAFYAPDQGNRPWGSTVSYAESHDEERMGYKAITWGATTVKTSIPTIMKRLGSVAGIMLLTPGPKMIWQFGELGDMQTTKNSDGNDTSPKIVVWNYLDDPDREALHDIYKELCNLRQLNPSLFSKDTEFTYDFNTAMTQSRSIRLHYGEKELVAFFNPRTSNNTPVDITVATTKLNANNAKLICASPGFTPTLTGTGNSVTCNVPSHSMAVFATTNVSGVDNVVADMESSLSVMGGEGCVKISGDYNSVAVYTLAGVQCPMTGLAAGVYVVNVDGKAFKVVVR